MKRYILVIFILLIFTISKGQERLGICNSVYAGINGLWINPAFIAGSPLRYDFNIITFHTYADNNYIYFYKANIPRLISNGSNPIQTHNELNVKKGISSNIMMYDKYNQSPKTVYQKLLLQGPSLMLSYDKWSFALFADMRDDMSALNVDYKVAKVGFEGMSYKGLMKQYIYVPAFRINAAAWTEFGFTAATIVKHKKSMIMKAGITYKYLMGFSSIYFHNKSSYMYYPNDNDMDFYYVNAKYGHAVPTETGLTKIGSGHAVDLGFSYQKFDSYRFKVKHSNGYYYDRGSDCPGGCKVNPYMLYKWKLGVSLLDIGYIKCNNYAKTYSFTNASTAWPNFAHWSPKKVAGIDKDLNYHFNNDSLATPASTQYTTLLPMALSVRSDYNLNNNFYINTTLVQRLPHFNAPGIDRENLISVTPRFDAPKFGIAMPVLMYQYLYPRIGLAFRFGNFLIIGSDKIGMIFNNRLSGMDIYFSIKINAFNRCK